MRKLPQFFSFDFIKTVFLMSWLWTLFAGFYLFAYTFWVPTLFDNLLLMIPIFIITLFIGLGLLGEGFFRVIELERKNKMPTLPYRRVWQAIGGVMLLGYVLVYLPPEGRIVAHWSLDLAITVAAGSMMFYFAKKN